MTAKSPIIVLIAALVFALSGQDICAQENQGAHVQTPDQTRATVNELRQASKQIDSVVVRNLEGATDDLDTAVTRLRTTAETVVQSQQSTERALDDITKRLTELRSQVDDNSENAQNLKRMYDIVTRARDECGAEFTRTHNPEWRELANGFDAALTKLDGLRDQLHKLINENESLMAVLPEKRRLIMYKVLQGDTYNAIAALQDVVTRLGKFNDILKDAYGTASDKNLLPVTPAY